MLDIIVFLVFAIVIVPIGLLAVSPNISVLKYYPIVLILLSKYLTKLELNTQSGNQNNVSEEADENKPLFSDLYVTRPSTAIQYFSTFTINIFALIIVLLLAIRINMDISSGEKFIIGVLYFAVLYLLSNQGMDVLYEKTNDNNLFGLGYVLAVLIVLCLIVYPTQLGNLPIINLYNTRANNQTKRNSVNNQKRNSVNNQKRNVSLTNVSQLKL